MQSLMFETFPCGSVVDICWCESPVGEISVALSGGLS
jgi:hypothetical protein